jgi:multicomponent Na+:H+ antiporter subunit A
VAKSALFMTAGAVTVATGETRLSRLGGLARPMPLLACASGIAAATLAALPLTLGFFKDELFFAAAAEAGTAVQVLAVIAAALTLAYIGRFWLGLFAGGAPPAVARPPLLLVAPVALLALTALVGGVVVEPFARLAEDAAEVTYGAPLDLAPAYHIDLRAENVMAVAAWALGALVLLLPHRRAVEAVSAAGRRVGPRRLYGASLLALNRASDRIHGAEVRDLRTSLAAVLIPTAVLVAIAFLITPTEGAYDVGEVHRRDAPIIVLLALVVAAAVAVLRSHRPIAAVLALSVVGFALGAVYAVLGAPDVALVAVVVEGVLTLVFIAVLAALGRDHAAMVKRIARRPRARRNRVAGVIAGVAAFVAIWGALSRPTPAEGDAAAEIVVTPSAHGGDVVTVILADFRGFDTLVEITVLMVAIVGVAALLSRGRWS